MKPTAAPLPANTPIVKNAKTNPAAAKTAEKKPRATAVPRSKPEAIASAPAKPTAKTVKTNPGPMGKAKIATKSAPADQIALPLDLPRAAPVPKAPRRMPAADVAKPAKTTPALTLKPKTIPVKSVKSNTGGKSATVSHSVKVVNEPVLEGGALWKMSGRNGVAYVKDAAVAGELLATDPKNLPKHAMAVYYDKKGKAFAWQVRFDTSRWEEVLRRLG